MAQVARHGVLILSRPGRATRLTPSQQPRTWKAGNRVRRLRAVDVAANLHDAGFPRVVWRRTLMYYPHEPFGWFRWLDPLPCYGLFRAAFWGVNLLFRRWGNKLALGATRGGW
jgi:hypothetical protein